MVTVMSAHEDTPGEGVECFAPPVSASAPRQPNVYFRVIVYDQDRRVDSGVTRGSWEGELPRSCVRGYLARNGAWKYDDKRVRSARLDTRFDGSGGVSVAAWADRRHGTRVEIFVEPLV